jgi:hypothetical protein
MSFKHGSITGYYNHNCRCEPCKVAGKEYRDKRKRTPVANSVLFSSLNTAQVIALKNKLTSAIARLYTFNPDTATMNEIRDLYSELVS